MKGKEFSVGTRVWSHEYGLHGTIIKIISLLGLVDGRKRRSRQEYLIIVQFNNTLDSSVYTLNEASRNLDVIPELRVISRTDIVPTSFGERGRSHLRRIK